MVFQPVYSPWVNHIGRQWHKLDRRLLCSASVTSTPELFCRVRYLPPNCQTASGYRRWRDVHQPSARPR
ncbi:hypothetical protein CX648_23005 [Aeromonas dhakensis]|nr:hypothetical protein CX648_23005 [Aeromonas dhakensis]